MTAFCTYPEPTPAQPGAVTTRGTTRGETDPAHGLRRTHVPVGSEYLRTPGEADDRLGEDGHAVVPGVVHRYPDRVPFLTTGFCSTYCRYCTRGRMMDGGGEHTFSLGAWQRGLDDIAAHPEVRDVPWTPTW